MATIATLVMAAPAPASTFSVTGANLVFEAAPGEVNELEVFGAGLGVTISQESAALTAGPGCSLSGPISVSCPYSGSTSLIVRMGDGADEFESVKGAKTLIPGSKRSGSVVTSRQIRVGSPPLCLFGRGSARWYVYLVHARAQLPETAERRKNREP